MRVLVNVFHPTLSEGSRVNRAWFDAVRDLGTVRDVYAESPGGTLDLERERALCEAHDRIVFQHPFNWYSCPWLMKRWIDEVLGWNWAYGDRYALAEKEWLSAVSVGAPELEYGRAGSRVYSVTEFLAPFERTAAFVQMRWAPPFLAYGSGVMSDSEISASAARYRARIEAASIAAS